MKARTGILLLVVLVTAGAVLATVARRHGGRTAEVRTVVAERGEVKQDVVFTGKLEATRSADLGFETSGTVGEVLADVGEAVVAGQALVHLDDRLARLELAKVQADQEAAEEQGWLSLRTAKADEEETAEENATLLGKKRQTVRDAKAELDQQRVVFTKIDAESGDVSATASALVTVRVKESAYRAAREDLRQTLATVEKTHALKRAATAEAEARYQATVRASGQTAGLSSLGASRELSHVKLANAVLRAPFAGVVAVQDAVVGELVTPGTPVATVATLDDLKLTADVPETDATKLVPGATAIVTFDAFGSAERWDAEVVSIAPAAKVIEGVPTYEVPLRLATRDPRFRPGLTANITVHAATHENVIAVPRRAVVTTEDGQVVRVLRDGTVQDVRVMTGLLGSDGRVEILSGLSGGERIVVGRQTQ